MSKINDGGPAFPLNPEVNMSHSGKISPEAMGMSLRDWFAGQALVGLLTYAHRNTQAAAIFASDAFLVADAMLSARQSQEGEDA